MGSMDCDNNSAEHAAVDPKIFSAIITPHRSLGPRGFLIFMLCLGGLSFIAGVIFVSLGAWPVSGFFGLDVLLVYFAFRANYRAARAYEEVTVTASELTVRKVSHRGGVRQWTLNPLWVRLERIVHEEFGIERLFRQMPPALTDKVSMRPDPAVWQGNGTTIPLERQLREIIAQDSDTG